MDWSEWQATRAEHRPFQDVPLCADAEAVRELEQLRGSLPLSEEQQETHAEALEEVKAQVASATMVVRVEALPAHEYRDLKDAHRPQDKEARKRGDEWTDAFRPALVAACLTEDGPLKPDDVPGFWEGDEVTLVERERLFLACWSLNEQVPDLGFTLPGTT